MMPLFSLTKEARGLTRREEAMASSGGLGAAMGGMATGAPLAKALQRIQHRGARAALLALGIGTGMATGGATGAGVGALVSPKETTLERIQTHLPSVFRRQGSADVSRLPDVVAEGMQGPLQQLHSVF